jgi:hypothetical protein
MEFIVSLLILAGIVWLVINYWPIILALIVVGVIIYVAVTYEPPPDPKREIRQSTDQAVRNIQAEGAAYQKRVGDLDK